MSSISGIQPQKGKKWQKTLRPVNLLHRNNPITLMELSLMVSFKKKEPATVCYPDSPYVLLWKKMHCWILNLLALQVF